MLEFGDTIIKSTDSTEFFTIFYTNILYYYKIYRFCLQNISLQNLSQLTTLDKAQK